jgi:acetylornithine deacetylase
VGEPTGLAVTTGHKGKLAARVRFMGSAGHSALAPFAVNALYLANEFTTALGDVQVHLQASGVQDAEYDVSYTALHVGRISSGGALSAVPYHCELDFEIRHLAQDDPQKIL